MQIHTNSHTSWTILSDTDWVKIASNSFLSRYLNLFQVGEFFGIETQSSAKKKKKVKAVVEHSRTSTSYQDKKIANLVNEAGKRYLFYLCFFKNVLPVGYWF